MTASVRFDRRRLTVTALAVLCLSATGTRAAPPEGKGPPDKKGGKGADKDRPGGKQGRPEREEKKASGQGGGGGALVSAGITVTAARNLAVEVGIEKGSYQPLPPGIRKNLARGKPLPPGIAKKMAPPPLVARLPVHPGYEWRVVGTDLVLVAIATLIIADVLFDVF